VADAERSEPEVPKVATLDVTTLTLGEMAEAERQSGRSFDNLLTSGTATRRLLALFIVESRTCAQPRSWQQLADLRPYDSSSSPLPSEPAGTPTP
jgi:hypothetical protein